jgi:hypothetical protein
LGGVHLKTNCVDDAEWCWQASSYPTTDDDWSGFTKFLETFKIDRCPDCARTNLHVHCVHQHGGVKANDIHPDMATRRDRLREQLWRRRELYEDAAPSRA